MNSDLPTLEARLRRLRWKPAPTDFLRQSLADALCALPQEPARRSRFSVILWIPRPLRWPLAACWLCALFFHFQTPPVFKPAGFDPGTSPIDPEQVTAHFQRIKKLAQALSHLNEVPTPPL